MKVRKMIRWGICLVGVVIMLSGLTGCIRTEKGLEKQFNKDKKFNARLEQELEEYYEEEFEVLYHKAQMEPASFFKMQTYAVCVPKAAPDLEFKVWYDAKTKESLSCTYLSQMDDYAIRKYGEEIADKIFEEEYTVFGEAHYNGTLSSKKFTWRILRKSRMRLAYQYLYV